MRLLKKLISVTVAIAVITAVVPFSRLVAGAAAESISAIAVDEEKTVIIDENNAGFVTYLFTPSEDGFYAFYSYNGILAKGKIIDISENTFINSPERKYYGGFYIQYEMKAGRQYLLSAEPLWKNERGKYSLKVTKLNFASGFRLQDDSIIGLVGKTVEVKANFYSKNSEMPIIENISWTSSDESVVSVETRYAETPDISGVFTFKKVGTATVNAVTGNGYTDSVTVKVAEPVTITLGEEKQLSYNDELSGAGIYSFVPEVSGTYAFYSYNNSQNCSTHGELYDSDMNRYGDMSWRNGAFYIYGYLQAGQTYYFKCQMNGYVAEGASYSVKLDRVVQAESVSISVDSTEVYVGTGAFAYLSEYPINALPENCAWSLDNNSVAYFEWENAKECHIKFVSAGTVTLSATTENGLSDSIVFTVSEPDEIVLGEENNVNIVSPNNRKLFKLTPNETVSCYFSADTNNASFQIYDSDMNCIIGYPGSFSYTFSEGETYYLYAGLGGNAIGNYTFTVTRQIRITSIEIISLPTKLDYYEFENWYDYSGLRLKITDENGKEYYWSDWSDDIGEFRLDIHAEYYDGNYQYTEISCGGATTTFRLNIHESPVESIEINKAPNRVYIYGDPSYGYTDDYGNYHLHPEDITGIQFTVNYKNGTSVQYGDDAFADGVLERRYLSFNVQNDVTNIGNNTVVFSYMNVEATYEVEVKENTVRSIELTKAPNNTKRFEYFAPDLTGAEFTITHTDNTTEIVTVTSENQYYYAIGDSVVTLIPAHDSDIIVTVEYDENNNQYYLADYLSKTCTLECFVITESKKIKSITADNFNKDLQNTVLNVTYTDSTTERFPLSIVNIDGDDEFKQIVCRSDKGLFTVVINRQDDQSGYKQGYYLFVFDNETFISDPFGDVTGDGVSDIRDLIRLKKIIAGATNKGKDKADLNGNGSIQADDAVEFRRYLLVNNY